LAALASSKVLIKVDINWPPFIEILQLSFCVMNYAHLVYGMLMASAARA
jgi:hypothetical protein